MDAQILRDPQATDGGAPPGAGRRRGSWRRAGILLAAALALVLGISAAAVRIAPLSVGIRIARAHLMMHGIYGHSIEIAGTRVHYLEGGEGDPVVLVHGLGGSAEQDWDGLIPHLVESGHRVFAIDLPGFGASDKPRDRSYSIREQASVVRAFLDARGLDRVALAGDSMGGWIASMVALEAGGRVGRLILFDSPGLAFRPGFDLATLTPRTIEQVDAMLALLFLHAPPIPEFVKRDLILDAERDGWVIERALASMLTGADVLDRRLQDLRVPLLIVWGKQDAVTPLPLAEAMHRLVPGSALEIYDGCAHASVVSCTERIAPRIVDFLRGAASQRGRRVEVPVPNAEA